MSWVVLNNEDFRDTDNEQIPKETGLGIGLGKSLNTPIYNAIEQARNNLINLILTIKGERVMQPSFGTDLMRFIFLPNTDSELKQRINATIFESVAYWLPYVQIQELEIITADTDPNLNHYIVIKLTWSVNELDSDTITFTADEAANLTAE